MNLATIGILQSSGTAAGYDSDFQAVITLAQANGDTIPDGPNLLKINNWVLAKKADGTWAETDILYNFITGTPGESLRNFATYNYKNPALHRITIVGNVTYDGLTGWWGNGGYLNTNWAPKTHGVKFTLNNAGFGFYCGNDIPTGDYIIYSSDAAGANNVASAGKNATNALLFRLNCTNAVGNTTNNNLSGIGNYHHKRTASNALASLKNAVVVTSSTEASTDRSSFNVVVFSANIAGAISIPSNKNIANLWFGASCNGLEAADNTTWNNFMTAIVPARANVLADESTLVTLASHCWFARNKAVYDAGGNKTYFSSVHNALGGLNYSQYIFELNNATGGLTKFKLGSAVQMDDHNEPGILIRASDSKLFSCYSEHSGASIKYRLSINALSIAAWGAETTIDPNPAASTQYTYPSPYEDASGNIWIFFRDSNGIVNGWSYVKSTDGGVTFGTYTPFYGNTYMTTNQDPANKNIIHILASGHPGSQMSPNYITHFYFNCATATFHKSDGTDITANILLLDTEMTVIKTMTLPDTSWLEDIMIDPSTGFPRALFIVLPNSRNDNYLTKQTWYSEWNGTVWSTPHMLHVARVGYMETDPVFGVLESPMYSPNCCFDRGNINRIFAAKDVTGTYGVRSEIFEYTRVSSSSFTAVQKTSNSLYDQWRPFTTNAAQRNVFWLHKIMYNDWFNKYHMHLINATI